MKIGIIIDGISGVGGAQRQAIQLAKKLRSNCHDVTIYCFNFDPRGEYENLFTDLRIVSINDFHVNSRRQSTFNYLRRISLFKSIIERYYDYRMKSIALAKIIDTDVEILNPHDRCYHVAYHFNRLHKLNKPVIAMINDVPLLEWVADRFEEKVSLFNRQIRRLLDYIEIHYLKTIDQIVVLDKLNQNILLKYTNLKSDVIRSGLDLTPSINSQSRQLPTDQQPIKILVFGIFMKHRRFEDVIRAISLLSHKGFNVTLTIAGDYQNNHSYKNEIDKIVESENLSNIVKFTGKLSEQEVNNLYQQHDIFVFSNHLQTWGLVVFEAMYQHLPTIVSSTCGASEVLTDGDNALIFKAKDPNHLAGKIESVIVNKNLYKQLSNNGYNFVKTNISWDNYANSMSEIFKKFL